MSLWTETKEPRVQIPDGLAELLKDFAKEAMKTQPNKILIFGQEYFVNRCKEENYSRNRPQLNVIISGAPAAGKGTQCRLIEKEFGPCHISIGDLLHDEVANQTEVGNEAKQYMDIGALVPDETVISLVKKRLAEPDALKTGWLLDGFPMSEAQADALEEAGIEPHVFVLVQVPDDILVDRISGRRLDPETGDIYHLNFSPPSPDILDRLIQPTDDTEDKVKSRLLAYHQHTAAVLNKYKAQVLQVNGNQPLELVWNDVQQALTQNQLHRCAEIMPEAEF